MTSILDIFDKLSATLEKLSALAQKKIDVVRRDDLTALNDIMKQEQAYALSIRGIEQKLTGLLKQFGLQSVKLNDLPKHFPAEHQVRASKTVDELRTQYKVYSSVSQVARNTLEINLHEIEKILAAAGADNVAGPGYAVSPDVEPPAQMKTDIRV